MPYDVDRFVSWDLETFKIEDGVLAPPPVCASTARLEGGVVSGRLVVGGESHASKVAAVVEHARELHADLGVVVVGANVAYDHGVAAAADPALLPAIFRAYAEGRVFDVQVAQALHAIRSGDCGRDPRDGRPLGHDDAGRYSLVLCVELVLGRTDAKARDLWRQRYGLLADVPVEDWPADARQYPVDDAENTLEVAVAQVRGGGRGFTPGPHENLDDMAAQAESAWALHLGAMHGLRVDPERVRDLRARVERDHKAFVERFARFFKSDGKEDGPAVKRAVAVAYGASLDVKCPECFGGGKVLSKKTGAKVGCPTCGGTGLEFAGVPRTPAGGVSKDKDTLAESGDADLVAYSANEPEKIRSTYLPWLEKGLDRPLILRPNVLVSSGRTSYDGLIQLMTREGGVRECVRARGPWCGSPVEYAFVAVDYAALELCTFAQVCLWVLGRSKMAEMIREVGSPTVLHTAFAARIAGQSFDDFSKRLKASDLIATRLRQVSKSCNFALLGGMGAAKFVLTQRKANAGETIAPDGKRYPGTRFCIVLGGDERCGETRIVEWRGRQIPAACRKCVEIANDLRSSWFAQWDEVRPYHDWVSQMVDAGGEFPCFVPDGYGGWTASRTRGGLDFTNGANNGFQALAADGAKAAKRALVREIYLDRASVLRGSRLVFFVHDENMLESPLELGDASAHRVVSVMEGRMQDYVPDVPIKAEPSLMFRWSKSAKARKNVVGELVPWDAEAVS